MPVSRLSAETALGAGLVLPFEHSYEIVVRFIGMADNANLPSVEHVKELGRQGLLWITTFTAEGAKHKQ
jgi:hypothetical protein